MATQRHPPPGRAGFSLLEALVTMVVISIGLLGILGLKTASLAHTRISAAHTFATLAVDSMAERIRANLDGARRGAYDGLERASSASAPVCHAGSACSAVDMARRDAWEWDRRIADSLPNGHGEIACVELEAGDCVVYRLRVVWEESGLAGHEPQRQTLQVRVQP